MICWCLCTCEVLFLALSVTFLFVYKISRESLNGFVPNLHGRRCLVPRSDEFEGQYQFRLLACGLCLEKHLCCSFYLYFLSTATSFNRPTYLLDTRFKTEPFGPLGTIGAGYLQVLSCHVPNQTLKRIHKTLETVSKYGFHATDLWSTLGNLLCFSL